MFPSGRTLIETSSATKYDCLMQHTRTHTHALTHTLTHTRTHTHVYITLKHTHTHSWKVLLSRSQLFYYCQFSSTRDVDLSPSLTQPADERERVCVCVRVDESACRACVWVLRCEVTWERERERDEWMCACVCMGWGWRGNDPFGFCCPSQV